MFAATELPLGTPLLQLAMSVQFPPAEFVHVLWACAGNPTPASAKISSQRLRTAPGEINSKTDRKQVVVFTIITIFRLVLLLQ